MLLNIDLAKTELVPVGNLTEFKDLVKKHFGEWNELHTAPKYYPCFAVFAGNIWDTEGRNTCVFAFIYTK